ncbi:IucA/IucC family protein [Acinetobacter courvalinii]|uniref:Siderophore biosynthesis protein IucA n=1 Tax=Acinetobacter courvalinii TaxID=280147 RepID=N9PVD3_9GAMM|nr:IucA/IucC family protein [Acinetobacter courvalinii]ENX37469.1 hypothetical protein F888_02806 [Acinetobacter courvalinii]KAB0658821.1 IucA/IucC family siderophore biosynthesis protein [Acinetobacter courvalinii]RSN84743.1 IucA/IucC family siderophore biosynthesis protein [Acinetobacter baumannii]GGH27142.1 siderophore biosynthesis protein IucA [Acinetobacter courvalinii]
MSSLNEIKILDQITQGQMAQSWLNQPQQEIFKQVEHRVIRQLIQAMLYEKILSYRSEKQSNGTFVFSISGISTNNEKIEYQCTGNIYQSFSLIRLSKEIPVLRVSAQDKREATLQDIISEILLHLPDTVNLASFIHELEQTLIKDTQARSLCMQGILSKQEREFDELESNLLDAHTYHPCYKSRIGFTLTDNYNYGAEFKQPIHLIWVAVHKNHASINMSCRLDQELFIDQQLDQENQQKFKDILITKGLNPRDYVFMPVHPWQWENTLITAFYFEIKEQKIVLLGQTQDSYRAQQSLRSLTNFSDLKKPYIKLSMNMTNTSSTRILARHTVMNGPIITDWLQQLIQSDETAKKLDFVVLGEFLGVSFNHETLVEERMPKAYGTMGAIWRESIHQYLKEGEEAIPFNGLSYIQSNKQPLIDTWIQRYGAAAWTQQLLKVAVLPIIHMLYAEGIGMESHGQNIVLIHRDGWPTRIALKDFHDGVRYSPAHLARQNLAPNLVPLPASHAKINRNSFILTEDLDAVRDFSCDCFFFICLTDIAIFLQENYQFDENLFWKLTADLIHQYQVEHPQHQQRFGLFNLFSEQYQVEELTKRRLLGDSQPRFKTVPNPLHQFSRV